MSQLLWLISWISIGAASKVHFSILVKKIDHTSLWPLSLLASHLGYLILHPWLLQHQRRIITFGLDLYCGWAVQLFSHFILSFFQMGKGGREGAWEPAWKTYLSLHLRVQHFNECKTLEIECLSPMVRPAIHKLSDLRKVTLTTLYLCILLLSGDDNSNIYWWVAMMLKWD